MQALSFQINQAVLVQTDTPYQYQLAKILHRTENQDQDVEYQIRFYKGAENQSTLINGFKIKKLNLKLFWLLKEQCKHFPELANSFRSVQSELSKNEVFIEKQKQDRNWKRLFKKCVLYLQAKRSLRIKYQSKNKYSDSNELRGKLDEKQSKNNSFNLIVKVSFEKRRRKVAKSNLKKGNRTKTKEKSQQLQTQQGKVDRQRQESVSKKRSLKSQNQRIQRYNSLYLFGLNYIAYTQKLAAIEHQFNSAPAEMFMMAMSEQQCSEQLDRHLDEFKNVLFSAQLKGYIDQHKIQQLEAALKFKLNALLHLKLRQFPQDLIAKIGLVIKIYSLQTIQEVRMIIGILKLWLRLFLGKMKVGRKPKQLRMKTDNLTTLYQEIANIAILQ